MHELSWALCQVCMSCPGRYVKCAQAVLGTLPSVHELSWALCPVCKATCSPTINPLHSSNGRLFTPGREQICSSLFAGTRVRMHTPHARLGVCRGHVIKRACAHMSTQMQA